MKVHLTIASTICALALSTATASAGHYFLRGDFNTWSQDDPMTHVAPGQFSATITGLTPGDGYEFKVSLGDWIADWPGSNARAIADADGELTVHFYEGDFFDGWSPASNRVGYDDPGHGWQIIGTWDTWTTGVNMTSLGGGVYQTSFTFADADNYEFKFRKEDDWGVSIGGDFGNSAGNIELTTTSPGETWYFTLDLPGGRWQVVPEPATLSLLAFGGLGLLRRRR